MPEIDDLAVIRELLTGKPPSQEVNDYVKGRLTAVTAAAEPFSGAGRPVRRVSRSRATVAGGTRLRHRRLVLRLTAGAVAAAAVAFATVVVPGAGRGGLRQPAADTAYVVQRVSNSLSAAGPGEIAQIAVTTRIAGLSGGTTATITAQLWSYGDQWRMVTNSPAGYGHYDEGSTAASVYTFVNYQAGTWARQTGRDYPAALLIPLITRLPDGCVPVFGPVPAGELPGIGVPASSQPSSVAKALRTAISCGTLTLAGRQRVDGIETIKLTSRPGSAIPETIWVDADTYLPVRVAARLVSAGSGTTQGQLTLQAPGATQGQLTLQQTADITWLRPTAQNLDELTVPVPSGFRHVPLAQAARPDLFPVP